jgi:FAD/FMN-containing dehydrogenase
MTPSATGAPRAAEELSECFAAYRPRIATTPLFDFSMLHQGEPMYCEVAPRTPQELSAVLRLAVELRVPLRTRGAGHALNGSALPLRGELVISTRELDQIVAGPAETVRAGAGAVLWTVDAVTRARGRAIPVLNAGQAGPTVGGFIAAGGFGAGSAAAGGFWENVIEVTLVDGRGALARVTRESPLFPWLFGGMGQLGIVVDATLQTVPSASAPPPERGRSREDEPGTLFWFTFFVAPSQLPSATDALTSLEGRYADLLAFRNRYTYYIAHREIVAPLVWPYHTPCFAVGAWVRLRSARASQRANLLELESDFMAIAHANGYRRYIQSELASGNGTYEQYFGALYYGRFRALKRSQDPYDLFNRGWVFA